jgi:hypothetical protein
MASKSVKKSMKQAARMGKGRDDTIGHLASGEVVIPLDFQRKFPAVGAALKDAFAKAGLDYDRFVVGSSKNRINPRTGAPMFDDDGGDSGNGGNEAGGGWGGSELGASGGEMGGANWSGEAPGGDPTGGDPTGGGPTDGNESYTDEYGRDTRDVYGPEYIGDRSGVTGSPGDPSTGANIFSNVLGAAPDYSEFDAFSATTLPGQGKFNTVMDAFLDNVLSGVFARETTAEDVEGGFQGKSSARQSGVQAEARAAEDAYNALVEDVARNEAAANALVADQAAQQAEAAAAAARAEAAANESVYGTVVGDVGQWSWNTDKVSSGYGATGVTGAGTPGLGTGDYGVSTQGSQIASTTSTGETEEGETASRSEALSDLPVTEVANAPNIFDITAADNLSGRASEQDGYYSGQTGGGGEQAQLSDEERLLVAQLSSQAANQQASVAPTVTPIKYDISKFISGIGSLATSKQT